MRYHVLATDYDGTLAHHGQVDDPTVNALERLLATGRRLVLVTGREIPDLQKVCPYLDLFEWIVAENGALLYRPSTKEEHLLATPPPEQFIQAMREKARGPLSVGRVVVATWEPDEKLVLNTIRQQGLELQVIFNKGAVMVLPSGVNKATGLAAALKRMSISPHNAVGIGDAENDHALLRSCEFSAAVANALSALKEAADLVTDADHGGGVIEVIDHLIADDLAEYNRRLRRHHLLFGKTIAPNGTGHSNGQSEECPARLTDPAPCRNDEPIALSPYGPCVLIAGPSASGKSTVATRIVESLLEQKYQFCLIDPEGDYELIEGALVFGGPTAAPVLEEVLRALEQPKASAVVCLTGMPISDRPPFFLNLLSQLLQMRSRTGRPHWLVLDEAHHLMPAGWEAPQAMMPEQLYSVMLITVHPDMLSPSMLQRIDTVMAVGPEAMATVESFSRAAEIKLPEFTAPTVEAGELLLLSRRDGASETPEAWSAPCKVRPNPSTIERRRHRRKYAEGQLPPERSFYFQGPRGKLNLRAQNLMLFLQLADGVDDATWNFHLHRGDYSQWFRDVIKDAVLAAEAERIEHLPRISVEESRKLVRQAVEREYTLPASSLPVPGAS